MAHSPATYPLDPLEFFQIKRPAMIRYEVRYQTPYNACEWRSQWFRTLEEAERMVDFYRSCGSPAHLAP